MARSLCNGTHVYQCKASRAADAYALAGHHLRTTYRARNLVGVVMILQLLRCTRWPFLVDTNVEFETTLFIDCSRYFFAVRRVV